MSLVNELSIPHGSIVWRSSAAPEAAVHFDWFAMFARIDAPCSSEQTRALLGWPPGQPGLIADIDHPAHFAQ